MAITQAMCTSFKRDILEGKHAFFTTVIRASTAADVFYMALYTSAATLNADTTAYTASNEVANGNGYITGGKILTLYAISTTGSPSYSAQLSFVDLTWTSASFTAYGALIYNSTQSNKAVGVLSFGADKTATAGNFTVRFPVHGGGSEIIRIT